MSSDAIGILLCFYLPTAFGVVMIRWLEWEDTNILRLLLFGLAAPVVIVVMVVKMVSRYVRHRLPLEIAELLSRTVEPKASRGELPEKNREYEAGQWRG